MSRGNALAVPKDCPGARSALCPENDANVLPISIHPRFFSGLRNSRSTRFSPKRSDCQLNAYRSMRKRERKRKKNVYRLTDFFSSRNGKAKNGKEIGIREPCNKRHEKRLRLVATREKLTRDESLRTKPWTSYQSRWQGRREAKVAAEH